jgi:hypothetical protein
MENHKNRRRSGLRTWSEHLIVEWEGPVGADGPPVDGDKSPLKEEIHELLARSPDRIHGIVE